MARRYANLRNHLEGAIGFAHGEWLKARNYEPRMCEALGLTLERSRFHDARWSNYTIELKRGNIWLNLISYCELLIEKPELNVPTSVSFFCVAGSVRRTPILSRIIVVSTPELVKSLSLNPVHARALLRLRDHLRPRTLNAQLSRTIDDVERVKAFEVRWPKTPEGYLVEPPTDDGLEG